ncbi:MAG: Gfo/Idh/MocA family protein [Armatimonadota bacterium]
MYRAAIVGCGRKAATLDDEERCRINYSIPPDAHAAAYRQIPQVSLVAAADPNEPKRLMMQERWAIPAVYSDYREMLRRERPDLVSVTTRTPLHAEVTIAAAEAGAGGVLCEKAMATSLREADMMIDACRRAGTRLIVNHTRRWHPTYERAGEALRDGAIGELRCIVGVCPGPLIHNGTHLFDLMRFFAGDIVGVTGSVETHAGQEGPGRDAPGRAMLEFASGAVGFVDLASRLGLAMEIQGTSGRLFIDHAEDGFTLWTYRSRAPSGEGRAWYQGSACDERDARHFDIGHGKGTLIAAIEELVDCIEHHRETRSSGHDGRAALELALAVYHSHANGGARVRLPLEDREIAVQSR